ncbi:ANGPTL1; angiopoietin-like 1 [Ferroglobus placidus DSM 10642]|uniref:ANGPTL1 angiopoietin-like 1 n=2 Tax=Ferroglobus placidus TaxID=54261 RepID=D3S1Y2_FERPA|nr:ANGPTL1; angiopoietin-like 1 [Ferroglobus placidus DSM 10642]
MSFSGSDLCYMLELGEFEMKQETSERKPRGINSFLNGVCKSCQYEAPNCRENLQLCILAEISYYIRKTSIILDLIARNDIETLRSVLERWE